MGEATVRTFMQIVYVLKSLKDQKLYIGCTSNSENRLEYHNKGKVKSTKHRIPFVLLYKESYDNIYDAFSAERYYKPAKGKRELINWPYRLTVRTSPFQGGNQSSILCRVTFNSAHEMLVIKTLLKTTHESK